MSYDYPITPAQQICAEMLQHGRLDERSLVAIFFPGQWIRFGHFVFASLSAAGPFHFQKHKKVPTSHFIFLIEFCSKEKEKV